MAKDNAIPCCTRDYSLCLLFLLCILCDERYAGGAAQRRENVRLTQGIIWGVCLAGPDSFCGEDSRSNGISLLRDFLIGYMKLKFECVCVWVWMMVSFETAAAGVCQARDRHRQAQNHQINLITNNQSTILSFPARISATEMPTETEGSYGAQPMLQRIRRKQSLS